MSNEQPYTLAKTCELPPGNSDFFDKNDPRPVLEIHLDINRTVALVRRGEGRLILWKKKHVMWKVGKCMEMWWWLGGWIMWWWYVSSRVDKSECICCCCCCCCGYSGLITLSTSTAKLLETLNPPQGRNMFVILATPLKKSNHCSKGCVPQFAGSYFQYASMMFFHLQGSCCT